MLPLILLLGPCGCGKGTLAAKLISKYNLHHLSAGDWLRQQTKAPILGVPPLVNEYVALNYRIPEHWLIEAFGLDWKEQAPPPLVLYVCSKANVSTPNSMWIRALPALKRECELISRAHGKQSPKAILLDNFPKTLSQSDALDRHFGIGNTPALAISLTCPADINLERFLLRSRGNDNAKTFQRRLERFEKESPAVIEKYRSAGKVVEMSAVDTPEHVYANAIASLERNRIWTKIFEELRQTQLPVLDTSITFLNSPLSSPSLILTAA